MQKFNVRSAGPEKQEPVETSGVSGNLSSVKESLQQFVELELIVTKTRGQQP